MMKKIHKFCRSIIKIFLPIISKTLIKLKLNRRVINFLYEKSYNSNNQYNLKNFLEKLLKQEKILGLDVGAQGGFNSDNFFPQKYNSYFEKVLVEPIKTEAEKLSDSKFIINKGLWNEKDRKKLYILDNRLGSSSMYEPDKINFDLHNIKSKDFDNYKVTRTIEVDCDTLTNQLTELNIEDLDYLKIDAQGAELNILKGLGNYRPLLIRIEAHFFSMYKDVPSWHHLVNLLYNLNYVMIDLKGIGNHNTRIPVEADMIFIPDFNSEIGKNLILGKKEKFLSIMLIFGQIKLLQIIMKKLKINNLDLEKLEDNYFN